MFVAEESCDIWAIVTDLLCLSLAAGRSAPLHEADGEADRRESPVCAARRNQSADTFCGTYCRNRKTTGVGTDGSNCGVVVGVAACRHCGGVDRTQE